MTTETPTPPVRIRFRQSFATVTAIFVMAAGAFAVAGQRWAFTPLMLVPLAALWWAVRTGVDVDGTGLTIRRFFGRRFFPWSDIEGFSSSGGRVALHLTAAAGGRRFGLPAVTPATLPRLIASVAPTTAPGTAPTAEPAESPTPPSEPTKETLTEA